MNYSEFITDQLKQASFVANKNFGHVTGSIKPTDKNQVLTETDLAIGKLLVNSIQKEFPNHNIIDEETGVIDRQSQWTWVIDPIDGTSNYAAGAPLYGTMIGLLKGPLPVAGGVILPNFQAIFTAEKGRGAFRNNQQIRVTGNKDITNALISYGIDHHHDNPELTGHEIEIVRRLVVRSRNIRSSNSVFDAMMVATGAYGGWLCQSSHIWDCIAPHVIIEEAGGIFTDFFGKPMDYSNPLSRAGQNFTQCAASPAIHNQLLTLILEHDQALT